MGKFYADILYLDLVSTYCENRTLWSLVLMVLSQIPYLYWHKVQKFTVTKRAKDQTNFCQVVRNKVRWRLGGLARDFLFVYHRTVVLFLLHLSSACPSLNQKSPKTSQFLNFLEFPDFTMLCSNISQCSSFI